MENWTNIESFFPKSRIRCTFPYKHHQMKSIHIHILTLFAVFLFFGLPARSQHLIYDVTIVDVETGKLIKDAAVYIDMGKIQDIGSSLQLQKKYPKNASIDGAGKYLIPGLWDMHIHTFFGDWVPGGREATLPLFVANGVTGVRDMGSDLEPILAARRDVEQGTLLGPRRVISGPMLDGPKSQFPAAIPNAQPPAAAAKPAPAPPQVEPATPVMNPPQPAAPPVQGSNAPQPAPTE